MSDRERSPESKPLSPEEVRLMQLKMVKRVGRKTPAARDAHIERMGLEPPAESGIADPLANYAEKTLKRIETALKSPTGRALLRMGDDVKRGPGRPRKDEVRLNITAPMELDQAMREIAHEDDVKVRDVWRTAGAEYVDRRRKKAR